MSEGGKKKNVGTGPGAKPEPYPEPEELEPLEIPGKVVLVEDQIRSNNVEIVSLKKENKELRAKFKRMNARLTRMLESVKMQAKKEKQVDQNSPHTAEERFEKEMENTLEQCANYQREIDFLQRRLEKGDQVERIQELESEVRSLTQLETSLADELTRLKTESKVLGNRAKRLAQPETHKAKVTALIEKRKTFTLKELKLQEEAAKFEEIVGQQTSFAKTINERYLDLCKLVKVEPSVLVTFNPDQSASVKLEGELKERAKTAKAKATVAIRTSMDEYMSEAWAKDNPDTYKAPKTEKEFEKLKEKLTALLHAERVERKKLQMKAKRESKLLADFEEQKGKLEQGQAELDREYGLLMGKIEQMKKSVPHGRLAPIENLIQVSQLKGEDGQMKLYFGKVDTEVAGERQVIGQSLKVRAVALSLWFLRGDLKGMQTEYSPVQKSVFVGEKTNLRQSISLNDRAIKSISCTFGDRIYSISLRVKNRHGLIQKIDIGYPPEDEAVPVEVEEKAVPHYQFIRSLTYYGEIEELPGVEELPLSDRELALKPNNGEPLLERNGRTLIVPENLKNNQYIKLTGIMFDIVA